MRLAANVKHCVGPLVVALSGRTSKSSQQYNDEGFVNNFFARQCHLNAMQCNAILILSKAELLDWEQNIYFPIKLQRAKLFYILKLKNVTFLCQWKWLWKYLFSPPLDLWFSYYIVIINVLTSKNTKVRKIALLKVDGKQIKLLIHWSKRTN